ncbi:MAG TPA: TonB family protein, partial [Rhodothermales bacterium]|nr:TonB family protein [Rhodothermales bacterium]
AVSGALYRTAQRLMRADPKLAGKAVAIHVALTVNEDGVGAAPRLVASSGLAALDEAVLRVIQTIRFTPGLLDGEPAPARAVLPFRVVFSDE